MPYLDYNATTPLSRPAREVWLRAADQAWQNPSSPYRSAARVRNLLENARSRLADMLGCEPGQVVFNSGGTEGVNALFGYCASREELRNLPALLSPVEHPCVLEAAKRFFGGRLKKLPLRGEGEVSAEGVTELLRTNRAAVVSAMAANNETGTIQPWQEILDTCREAGVLLHCDAAQWAGKLPLQGIGRCGFVTASAHKFGGPKGCGFLVVPPEAAGFRGQVGGEQEHGLRAGTEDYPAVAAMIAALEEAEGLAKRERETGERRGWREAFEREVGRRLPGSRVAGQASDRLWNTVSLVFPFGANDRWVRKLDRAGFEISTGSACSTGKEAPSHVLAALGFTPEESKRAVRASSGWLTTREDWEGLAAALEAVFLELKSDRGGEGGLTEVVRI